MRHDTIRHVIVLLLATLSLLVGLGVAYVLMRGRVSVHMPPRTSSMGGGLPTGPLTADDIGSVRFDVVLRGYRMDQVDDVLARLQAELADRDSQIALLRDEGSVALRAVPREERRPGRLEQRRPPLGGPGAPEGGR